jgi:hypothetical protein
VLDLGRSWLLPDWPTPGTTPENEGAPPRFGETLGVAQAPADARPQHGPDTRGRGHDCFGVSGVVQLGDAAVEAVDLVPSWRKMRTLEARSQANSAKSKPPPCQSEIASLAAASSLAACSEPQWPPVVRRSRALSRAKPSRRKALGSP